MNFSSSHFSDLTRAEINFPLHVKVTIFHGRTLLESLMTYMEHAVLLEKKSDMSRPSETRDAIQIGKHFFLQNPPGSISDKCGLLYIEYY